MTMEGRITALVQAIAADIKALYAKGGYNRIDAQTGTTYTMTAEANVLTTLSNAAAITVTIPADGSVTIPANFSRDLIQMGAGQVTFTAENGVTLNGTPGLKTRSQYSGVTVVKLASNQWIVVGDLAA